VIVGLTIGAGSGSPIRAMIRGASIISTGSTATRARLRRRRVLRAIATTAETTTIAGNNTSCDDMNRSVR
jgi:hypothetical protein